MKKSYIQQDIDQFFSCYKELPNSYKLERVRQIINNPDAKAMHTVKLNHKPFKFIIMTSAFIPGAIALLCWLTPSETYDITYQSNIPVEVDSTKQLRNSEEGEIFTTESKIPKVKPKNKTIENTAVKRYLNADIVKYEAKNITEGLRLIELSKSDLQKLGFVLNENDISYNTPLFEINLFKEGQGITIHEGDGIMQVVADTLTFNNDDSLHKPGNTPIKLVYLSNEFGEHNVKWTGPDDDREKNTFEYFQQRTQFLVPVYLRKSVYPKQLYQDQIFWFEPSMALFDAMPDSIGQQLKREYIYITTGNKGLQKDLSPTCIYFEACKSTFDMEEFKVYPNPANTAATIEFSIPVSSTGFISLVSISGTQLKFLVPTTTFPQGKNSFEINVSDVPPGIYLVFISTDNGFKKQRLIVNR